MLEPKLITTIANNNSTEYNIIARQQRTMCSRLCAFRHFYAIEESAVVSNFSLLSPMIMSVLRTPPEGNTCC